ncbi:NAD(P)-binding protein [Sinomonas gamaensis]|uniref:NAD(P)-binding protein n=1 Tax=Sinomonas gamaensis TaxID=2565624 RepID=UPI001107CEE4
MSLEADYLIVGSGAVGMAFADVLVHETESTIAVVDRRHAPGGHWNDAYPSSGCISRRRPTGSTRGPSATANATPRPSTVDYAAVPAAPPSCPTTSS